MNKNSLKQFYNSLFPNLWIELMFFFPEKQIHSKIREKFDFLKEKKILNKLFVLDNYKGPIEYVNGRDNKNLIFKHSGLSDNIFKLLEKKSSTKAFEFNYIIEKYFEQVDFLFFVSNWMLKNIDMLDNINDHITGCFIIQNNQYKKHYEEVIRHFYPNKSEIPKSQFNPSYLINNHFSNLEKKYKLGEYEMFDFNFKSNSTTFNNAKPISKHPPKKKKPLITEDEATQAILKTYFGIIS